METEIFCSFFTDVVKNNKIELGGSKHREKLFKKEVDTLNSTCYMIRNYIWFKN